MLAVDLIKGDILAEETVIVNNRLVACIVQPINEFVDVTIYFTTCESRKDKYENIVSFYLPLSVITRPGEENPFNLACRVDDRFSSEAQRWL